MTDQTTRTPVEIDTELAELYQAEFALEAKLAGELLAIRRGLGQRATVTGRGAGRREEWPTSADEAVAAMRAKGDALIGMMRTASSIVDKHDAAAVALAANRAGQAEMNAEYHRRGGWTRFFAVPGGHVHRTMHCSTCNNGRERTRFDWLIEWSGRDQDEAIAELAAAAHTLCSQPCCFPGAPVAAAPARKTAAERAAERDAAAAAARVEDPKLIADVDGAPLRVAGDTLRTVRTAEIKGADALWWAAYGRHTGEPNEAYAAEHEGHARKIAAALAAKRGTTPAAELAALVVKATKKVRRDLGAEVADAAAAEWTRQAAAAAAPAPLTAQPELQHAGRDEQPAPAAGHDVLAIRMRLAAIGQVTRELTDDQVAELGRRLTSARPHRAGGQLHPFLAARLAQAEDGTAVRRCCTVDTTDADCEAVHPGFTTPTAAYAALAAELEAGAADPAGYLAEHLGRMDAAAAAAVEASPTWATWEAHGRPAAAMLYGTAGLVEPAGRGEPVTIAADERGRVVARSVGGRYITTTAPYIEWLLFVPRPAGDVAACRFCGCTEDRACPGGCAWASDEQAIAAGLEPMDGDVCTACIPAAATDDEALDDAAAFDAGLAEVLAIAAAAPPAATVTVTDPAGVLDLVRQYATEWHRFLAITPETASIDDADRAEAAAAGTLSRIAEALGVAGDHPAAAVPAPRLGDGPPAG